MRRDNHCLLVTGRCKIENEIFESKVELSGTKVEFFGIFGNKVELIENQE